MQAQEKGSLRSAAELEVDFDAIARLVLVLGDLAAEFSGRDGTLQGELGDPDLADALRHAERDWWNQRRALRSFLDGASRAIQGGLHQYEQIENEISGAAAAAFH
jgi:hypothetical protein